MRNENILRAYNNELKNMEIEVVESIHDDMDFYKDNIIVRECVRNNHNLNIESINSKDVMFDFLTMTAVCSNFYKAITKSNVKAPFIFSTLKLKGKVEEYKDEFLLYVFETENEVAYSFFKSEIEDMLK